MFSLEKIQELFGDSEDFLIQNFIMAVNFGNLETIDSLFESIRDLLEEKRQDDLLELVDYYLENHCYNESDDDADLFVEFK